MSVGSPRLPKLAGSLYTKKFQLRTGARPAIEASGEDKWLG